MLKLHFLFCLLMCLPAWASAHPRYERFDLPVALSGGATAAVEIAWPSGRLPRALVVVVPNSGGLSDPYFNPELEKPVYDPDRRGGLTEALVAAGYAVAFYNQRGYAQLRSCITGADFHARAISFVAHCIDPAIRAGVTLSTITADTASVFAALETHPRTSGLRQIALPYSEGMHHVSALVGRGAIHPVGIVAVGGPHLAIGELVRYQAQHEFFVAVAARAFAHCPDSALTGDQLFACAGVRASPDQRAKMAELIGAASLTRELLPPRRELFRTHYQLGRAAQRLLPPMATMDGGFGGIPIPVAWNAHYSSQQLAAATSSVEQLGDFGGKVVYLFGTLDYLFPLPRTGACRTSDADAVRAHCRFELVDNVGHGLEDASGFMPAAVRERLVEAIDEVNAR